MTSRNLARLTALLGPPPPDVVPVPWEEAPAEIGFQFPADYRELIDTYGWISLNDEFWIGGPTEEPSSLPGVPTRFEDFVRATTRDGLLRQFDNEHAAGNIQGAPYPVLPTPGGLLRWGGQDVDNCFWLTEGPDPDTWPIVVLHGDLEEWIRFEGGVVEFLIAVCTQQYEYWDELLLAPLGELTGRPYELRGDWSGSRSLD